MRSLAFDLSCSILSGLEESERIEWPCLDYQTDPVRFFREILGIEPWDRQVELIEAIRDHRFGACAAGRKVSKTMTIAGIALWFYCSFPRATVVMFSTTARQVDQLLWFSELRPLVERSGCCVDCRAEAEALKIPPPRPCHHSAVIQEVPGIRAHTGLRSKDFRSIVGYTARDNVSAQGTSGANLLCLADEAAGIPDSIIHALEGNLAGVQNGGLWMFLNPNKTEGMSYRVFKEKKLGYHSMRISSEDSPNVRQGRIVIPGLATTEYIERMREAYGVDNPLYKIHVQGLHVEGEDGKIISAAALTESKERWHEAKAEGRLYVGFDPAGEGGQGDESAFCARRGFKQIAQMQKRGLSEDAHLSYLVQFLADHRKEREVPVVVIDREGSIGSPLYKILRQYAENNPGSFEVIGVKASDRALREAEIYDRQRDALWANMARWIRDGGAILDDEKLEAELHCPSWYGILSGKLKATPKDEIRKKLERSPDRADALCLSVWEIAATQDPTPAPAAAPDINAAFAEATIDPYSNGEWWAK